VENAISQRAADQRSAGKGAPGPAVKGWVTGHDPSIVNVPNLITILRTVVALVLAMLAIVNVSVELAVAAYLSYWIGDMLDGLSARLLGQETRFGAVLDIVSDRANCALCVAALLVLRPEMALPCTIFLVQFLVIDCQLSLSFLRWPLLSPNYFYLVHRSVYRWNWSPPAKVFNTTALVILVIFTSVPWYATAFALAVAVIKTLSLVTVYRLPAPAGLGYSDRGTWAT
jgi:CDP-diacylglycerol--glycerol-3-phosphate 3-phosphatidyltransferase